MKTLPDYLTAQHAISLRAHGLQRAHNAPVYEVREALAAAEQSPTNLYAWVAVIMAAIEGGLRSGSTPFALAQALVNQQTAVDNQRYPPPLAQFKPEAAKADRQAPTQEPSKSIGDDPEDNGVPSDAELAEAAERHTKALLASFGVTQDEIERRWAEILNRPFEEQLSDSQHGGPHGQG